MVYGDNIPSSPADHVTDTRRAQMVFSRLFCDTVNRRGGDAEILCLPDAGIRGNSHFMFSDLNNLEVADQLGMFLRKRGLDGRRAAVRD